MPWAVGWCATEKEMAVCHWYHLACGPSDRWQGGHPYSLVPQKHVTILDARVLSEVSLTTKPFLFCLVALQNKPSW